VICKCSARPTKIPSRRRRRRSAGCFLVAHRLLPLKAALAMSPVHCNRLPTKVPASPPWDPLPVLPLQTRDLKHGILRLREELKLLQDTQYARSTAHWRACNAACNACCMLPWEYEIQLSELWSVVSIWQISTVRMRCRNFFCQLIFWLSYQTTSRADCTIAEWSRNVWL
jgi:hypothetical protein